jgi:CheY-like chemotaxis protein
MKRKILLVDNDEDVRDAAGTLLEFEHFDVIQAKNGEDCINKLKKAVPDLILLDLKMPGLTTEEILEKFKEMKLKVPIIFLSGSKEMDSSELDSLIKEYGLDIEGHIGKPFDKNYFLQKVKSAMGA